MEVYDFFRKYEIAGHPNGMCSCEGCECLPQECDQFELCPLPVNYVFKTKREVLPK